jgi:DNA ligase (NAD+)
MSKFNNMNIEELERQIKKYQDSYYSGEGEISDAEFDALWDELKARKPDSPVLMKIGADSVDGFQKAAHIMPMGSQEKAAGEDEFIAWAEKHGMSAFVVQYKLDGASLELQYEDGVLKKAVTRGDGVTGDNIITNALKMRGVISRLDCRWTGGIRGEVLMFHDIWKMKHADKANCRNAANGLMRRKDGECCEDLDFVSYDAAAAQNDSFFKTEIEKLIWLRERGFNTSPSKEFNDIKKVIAYRAKIAVKRASLPFDIDGLVVKDPVTDMDDLRNHRPEHQIAFKFELEKAVSVLRDVEWSENGATYTPIGIIDPVRLAGTTVKRANLNNPAAIRAMGLSIGERVIVVKRGEIIPKIECPVRETGGEQDLLFDNLMPILIPGACGVCGAPLTDSGTRLYCPNTACPKRLLHRLEKWVSVLNIQEIGEKLLKQLFEKERLRRVADFYTMTAEELAGYERMGDISAAKIVRNLRKPRVISLAAFVAGFDIEGVGETIMDKVAAAGFNTLEKLRLAGAAELASLHGLGEITAQTIIDGLQETAGDMDATLAHRIISIEPPRNTAALPLNGMSFCFTGELKTMKRAEAEMAVKNTGGTVKSSVAAGLTYLVTNDPESGSAKNRKASKLGVKIIGEKEFLDLLS